MTTFIKEEKSSNVLVHCRSGVSRSASLVIAYCIGARKATFEAAYLYVKKRRTNVLPNDGFAKQLRAYEMLLGIEFDEDWDRGPLA